MNLAVLAAIVYGVMAFIGGTIGYRQAKSKMSLISGIASGILLLLGAIAQIQGHTWGLWLMTGVTAILTLVFAIRLIKTRKFRPAGFMLLYGTSTLVILITQLLTQ